MSRIEITYSGKIRTTKTIYAIREAELNGVVLYIGDIHPKWRSSLFNYVTYNLLHKHGYRDSLTEALDVPKLVNLLNHALKIFKEKLREYDCLYKENQYDYMHDIFVGEVNHPDKSKSLIFIIKNDAGGYVLMLEEDYPKFQN